MFYLLKPRQLPPNSLHFPRDNTAERYKFFMVFYSPIWYSWFLRNKRFLFTYSYTFILILPAYGDVLKVQIRSFRSSPKKCDIFLSTLYLGKVQTAYLGLNVFLLPLTLLGHIGFEYAKPTPASRPSYLQFSPPETLVCSSCLADAFISSHFLPKCYLPKAAFWSPDLNAACMDYYYACLPRAYVIWKFPLIYLLVYSMFFLLPPTPHLLQEEQF